MVARLDRAEPGQAIPLAALAQAAPAPPGSLARALKALAGRRVVVVKATEAGITVRLRIEDANSGGDLPSYPPGTKEWRVARWLVRRGQRPTEAAVAERLRAIEAAQRSEERRARWKAELGTETPVVVAFVQQVRTATGAGPTWAEVGTHMRWKYAEGNFKLTRLIAQGVLTASRAARSLDVSAGSNDASGHVPARDRMRTVKVAMSPLAFSCGSSDQDNGDGSPGLSPDPNYTRSGQTGPPQRRGA
ncbi:MAG: hypothetical protein M0Z46_16415 [Actinomycetota bacterium]|nr:hypothetical protein [Actinomycetota bacterium]